MADRESTRGVGRAVAGPKTDHSEYITPRAFMKVPERSVSHNTTPAGWPNGGALSSAGGPCLSGASWSALLRIASLRFNEARRGVNGFGSFSRKKRASPAGAKPGNAEHHVDTKVRFLRRVPLLSVKAGAKQIAPIDKGKQHIGPTPGDGGQEKHERCWKGSGRSEDP